jgi:coenzyme F420-reducing hydrogenase delta subunit
VREKLKAALPSAEVVFCCEGNPIPGAIALRCLGMLPPAFVEYALRKGASSVRAVGCEECAFRLGMELCDERFAGKREPHLRPNVAFERKNNDYRFVLRR